MPSFECRNILASLNRTLFYDPKTWKQLSGCGNGKVWSLPSFIAQKFPFNHWSEPRVVNTFCDTQPGQVCLWEPGVVRHHFHLVGKFKLVCICAGDRWCVSLHVFIHFRLTGAGWNAKENNRRYLTVRKVALSKLLHSRLHSGGLWGRGSGLARQTSGRCISFCQLKHAGVGRWSLMLR